MLGAKYRWEPDCLGWMYFPPLAIGTSSLVLAKPGNPPCFGDQYGMRRPSWTDSRRAAIASSTEIPEFSSMSPWRSASTRHFSDIEGRFPFLVYFDFYFLRRGFRVDGPLAFVERNPLPRLRPAREF